MHRQQLLTVRSVFRFYGMIAVIFVSCCFSHHAWSIGQTQYVQNVAGENSFPVVQNKKAAPIYVDVADWPGVKRAAKDLQSDVARVTQCTPSLSNDPGSFADETIIIGTVGKSRIIDSLAEAGKIDIRDIAGKWESFFLQVVSNPLPGTLRSLGSPAPIVRQIQ